MGNVQKWGFGMAPLKPKAEHANRKAISAVRDFVAGNAASVKSNIAEDISRVKGVFNRVIKQDQWDWFTVNMYLDYPQHRDLVRIVSALTDLRKGIVEKDDAKGIEALKNLSDSHFLNYCDNYLSFDINAETPVEYLYILSKREENDILKIGMTTRNVQKRVNEINSATGIVFPFSARKVYKVKDSKLVEKEIHVLLSEYRIRSDREFFRIKYTQACNIIEEYLTKNNQDYYE